MDQIKIGKFIKQCRKEKHMTQAEFAEILGVSDRTVSKWETGRGMPDISLFESICETLNVTINEFLSGERIQENHVQDFEENILSTIHYTNKKLYEKDKYYGMCFIILGILMCFLSIICVDEKGCIYVMVGSVMSSIGVFRLLRGNKKRKVLCTILYFIVSVIFCIGIDYLLVKENPRIPSYIINIKEKDNTIMYQAPFYNVYRINPNTNQEYFVFDSKHQYSMDSIPKSPFNRELSGFKQIKNYENKYIGNNSNDAQLINALPLSEYGYVFEIKEDQNLELFINYHISDWYVNDSAYVYKSLLYNSVSIFMLIDNVEYITYRFTGSTYRISRSAIENKYPHYYELRRNNQLKETNFNRYVENKMNDESFVKEQWENLFQKKYE